MSSVSGENPYLRLPGVTDPGNFYGSQRWVRFVLEEISAPSPRSLELVGLPGMGKSSLLRYLSHPQGALVQRRDALLQPFRQEPSAVFPVLVEFRLLPADTHAFLYMYSSFHRQYEDYRRRVPKVMGRPLPELTEEAAVADSDVAVDLLGGDTKILAQLGVRTVLLLDDFDIPFADLKADETTRLRPWREWVAFVLVTERRLDLVNQAAAGSPFFQTLPPVHLGGLEPDEARRLITEPADTAGRPFPSADVDFVLEQSGNHPYLLIVAGRALWDVRERLGLGDKDTPVTGEYQAVLRGRLLDDFRRSFQLYWDRLEAHEREALRAPVVAKEFTDKQYAVFEPLAEKGLMNYNPRHKRYEPFSPLFREFLREMVETPVSPSDLQLTGLERVLYEYLRQHAERVCSFQELWQEVWERPIPLDSEGLRQIRRPMQVAVSRLRSKLQKVTGEDVISVRGQGYRFTQRSSGSHETA